MATAVPPVLVRAAQRRVGGHAVHEAEECTLLELVKAVGEVTKDDVEVVATVVHMLRAGLVRLTGNFHSEPISEFEDATRR